MPSNSIKRISLSWVFTDYGMIFVLLLLCAYFSVMTYSEQSPTGEVAARQVASAIRKEFGPSPHVLIAVRNQADDIGYATNLEAVLTADGSKVVAAIKGEPRDAREALQAIEVSGTKLDAIACSEPASLWLVFADLKADFPSLGTPRLIKPERYKWPNFLKPENLLNIANQIAVIAIVAIGMTMVIVTGGIDLSVGSLVALSAVLATRLIRDYAGGVEATSLGIALSCIAAVMICGVFGAFSGGMITSFDVPPFIVTLAIMLVGRGLAYKLADGQSIYQVPESFVWLGRGANAFQIPNAVLLMLILYVLAQVMMSRMRLGRYLYAVGGNCEAARLSGVPVRRILLFAYTGCGLLAGLGGVIMASQLKSGSGTYGNMYELYVIAAVVVGGASLSGGEGTMLGTFTGALTIAVIQNGMNLTNVESYAQMIVLGSVILGAVLLDKIRHRR